MSHYKKRGKIKDINPFHVLGGTTRHRIPASVRKRARILARRTGAIWM